MKRPQVRDAELSKLLNIAIDAAVAARKVHAKFYRQLKNIRNKQDSSLVSDADHESEKVIRSILSSKFHEISFLGEEEGLEYKSVIKNQWIVDPLDGTTNYVHSYPFYCTSIGLVLNGERVLGVVDSLPLQKTYWAVKGFGAHCNGKKILVSESKKLKDSLLATGFLTYGGDRLSSQLDIFKKIIESSRGVRRSGSAALELCLLAEGALDGFWEFGLKPWDIAAGSIIIEEAGGTITDQNGSNFSLDCNAIVASNGFIQKEFSNLIK